MKTNVPNNSLASTLVQLLIQEIKAARLKHYVTLRQYLHINSLTASQVSLSMCIDLHHGEQQRLRAYYNKMFVRPTYYTVNLCAAGGHQSNVTVSSISHRIIEQLVRGIIPSTKESSLVTLLTCSHSILKSHV